MIPPIMDGGMPVMGKPRASGDDPLREEARKVRDL